MQRYAKGTDRDHWITFPDFCSFLKVFNKTFYYIQKNLDTLDFDETTYRIFESGEIGVPRILLVNSVSFGTLYVTEFS